MSNLLKQKGVSRKQRSKGAMEKLVREFVKSAAGQAEMDKAAQEIISSLPVSGTPALLKAVRRFALGEIGEMEFNTEFRKVVRKPADLIGHFGPMVNANPRLSSVVRDIGQGMSDSAAKAFSKIVELSRLSRTLGRTNEAKRRVKDTFISLRTDIKSSYVAKFTAEEGSNELNRWIKSLGKEAVVNLDLPSVDILVAALTRKAWSIASDLFVSPKAQSWTKQDSVDLMHLRYAPYVDIFCCDGGWLPSATASSKRYGTLVVGKLTELCPAIEKKLQIKPDSRRHRPDF